MAILAEPPEAGIAPEDATMGKVIVQVEMSSYDDEAAVEEGRLKPEQVRRSKIDALVDTGSTLMVLPEEEIRKLGLRVIREAVSRFANGQSSTRKIYGPVRIRVMSREELVLVMPAHPGMPALLGQIPLEGLDLMVDSKRQRLVPGHPDYPDSQLVEVY